MSIDKHKFFMSNLKHDGDRLLLSIDGADDNGEWFEEDIWIDLSDEDVIALAKHHGIDGANLT